MKTIRNRSAKPLRIPLSGGKVLHLGPTRTGQIHDDDLGRPAVQRLVKAGDLEVEESGPHQAGGRGNRGGHESTHGHPPTAVVHPKGDR